MHGWGMGSIETNKANSKLKVSKWVLAAIYPFFGCGTFCVGHSSGERGSPSIIFLAVSLTFQILITSHTITMATAAAMVWSGMGSA